MVDDVPVRGMRLLSDVYQRYNIVVCEPANYEESKLDDCNEGGAINDREKQNMDSC